jgi:hypothetical protein
VLKSFTASRTTTPLFSALCLASATILLAKALSSDAERTDAVNWSIAAAVSSSVAACCSVLRLRLSDAWLISEVSFWIVAACSTTPIITAFSLSLAMLKFCRRLSNSPDNAVAICAVKLPSASSESASCITSMALTADFVD